MRVILVPVADRPECRAALSRAFMLADQLSANIVGCHLRPDRAESASPRKRRYRWGFYDATSVVDEPSAKEVGLKSKAAKDLFMRLAAEHEFELFKQPRRGATRGALWREMVGTTDKLFPIIGPVADMSVVSRPGRTAKGNGPEFLLSAVVNSGRAVLILPQKSVATLGKRVLIAWNQSAEAARAVSAALPIIAGAESVHICSCGPEHRNGPKSTHLAKYLTMWGVRSTRMSTKGRDIVGEIEGAYTDTSSDLVVMGANSRSKMRELVFGGVTQHMLFDTAIPTLVYHS